MFARIIFLALLFTQCASPTKTTKKQLADASASYMRYIPGAGGGKGILFKVPLKNKIENFRVDKFLVNGIEVPANIEDSLIIASVFYVDAEPTVEEPNPEPVDAVLFNEEKFEAVIYYSVQDKVDSVRIPHFTEEEQPLYP